ncbi:hypothetical protein SSP531S_20310 [Streptomyces spongiicola]|uniref:Uncharacterized protein n=1 Tax=Streptomyces spongiicola TaxID=1690221 RepID=A0A388SVF2_9ACTN|nr:hypothetical protein SSP531S_20310 [Streptomyces spongiicola]
MIGYTPTGGHDPVPSPRRRPVAGRRRGAVGERYGTGGRPPRAAAGEAPDPVSGKPAASGAKAATPDRGGRRPGAGDR